MGPATHSNQESECLGEWHEQQHSLLERTSETIFLLFPPEKDQESLE